VTDPWYLSYPTPYHSLCEENVVENAQEPVPGTGAVSRFRWPPGRRIADHVHDFASLCGGGAHWDFVERTIA